MEKDAMHQMQASLETESQERHVEELAGPDDYWLTLTDAARATRRQDVSIRRWISKGLLPVKRQHVGLNQRTRLVRASDLAALTPIIDPAGAISTERGKLDLTSIPVQQAQIKAAQEHIVVQLKEMYSYVNKEIAHFPEMLNEQSASLSTLQQSTSQQFARLHDITTHLSQECKASLDELRHAVQQDLQRLWEHFDTVQDDLLKQLQMVASQTNVLATAFEETTKQQQMRIDSCMVQIQNEQVLREQLSEQVQQLSRQSVKQQSRIEAEKLEREQLQAQFVQIATHVMAHADLLEQQIALQVQLRQHITQVQAQTMQQHSALERHYEQLAESVTQDRQSSEQSYRQLSTRLASLTQEVQQHQMISHDYVKLMEGVEMLEAGLQEVRQRMIREDKNNA